MSSCDMHWYESLPSVAENISFAFETRYVVPASMLFIVRAPVVKHLSMTPAAGLILAFEDTSNSRHTTSPEVQGGKQVQGMVRRRATEESGVRPSSWFFSAVHVHSIMPFSPTRVSSSDKRCSSSRSTLPRWCKLPRASQQSSWLTLTLPRIHLRRQTVTPSDVAKHFVESRSSASAENPMLCR